MKWAEILAIFNFITWFLPIAFRCYLAWRLRNVSGNHVDPKELGELGESLKRVNFGSKKLDLGD